MKIGKSTIVHFISRVGLSAAGFVATFLIAYLLGADVLGKYKVVVALVLWLNIPTMAISSAINKRVSEGDSCGAFLSAGFILTAILGTAVALAVVFFNHYVNQYVGAPVSGLLAFILLADAGLYSVSGALDGQKKVASRGILQTLERVSRTGLQVALILLGWRLTGLLVGHAVSLAIAAILGIFLFDTWPTIPSIEQFRSLFEYARYAWLGTVQTRSFAWMDTLVLAFFVSSSLIGIYEVAWGLASVLVLVGLSIQQILFPELSELGTEGSDERIHTHLDEGLAFTGIFSIPGLFGVLIVGERLLRIYGAEFAQGATILAILVLARTISAYGAQFVSAINAIDRPDVAFRINAVFVVANVLLNVFLIYLFGWYGAAVATAISALLMLVLGYLSLSKLIGSPSIPTLEILRQIVAAGLMGISLLGLVEVMPTGLLATIVVVLLGIAIYSSILLTISTRIRRRAISLLPEPIRTKYDI
ncbi:polysaccharide biosynthesis C-terminal domain-containing protein [Natronomonas amylolytica]|uniref:oligosaccharide flippase family protein n=1 Tax=Natronomonas amylolytica TaxID=3108498 RepID=UPI003009BF0A